MFSKVKFARGNWAIWTLTKITLSMTTKTYDSGATSNNSFKMHCVFHNSHNSNFRSLQEGCSSRFRFAVKKTITNLPTETRWLWVVTNSPKFLQICYNEKMSLIVIEDPKLRKKGIKTMGRCLCQGKLLITGWIRLFKVNSSTNRNSNFQRYCTKKEPEIQNWDKSAKLTFRQNY